MCDTHEVPREEQSSTINHSIATIIQNVMEIGATGSTHKDGAFLRHPSNMNPATIPFIGDIIRENICIFIPGYFEFFHEVRIALATISTFMPGVRVVIATHPMDYHVFHRSVTCRYLYDRGFTC